MFGRPKDSYTGYLKGKRFYLTGDFIQAPTDRFDHARQDIAEKDHGQMHVLRRNPTDAGFLLLQYFDRISEGLADLLVDLHS